MSIADAIINAQNKVKAVYTKCEEKGATLPETQDLANLPATIDSIPAGSGDGSGDEVEAYALGEAKNAVSGDKVMLTPSALIFPGECSVSNTTVLVGSTSPTGSSLYVDPRVATSYYAKRWLIKTNGVFTSKSVTSNWCYPIAVGLFRGQGGYYFMLNTDTAAFSMMSGVPRDGDVGGAVNAAEDIVVCPYYNGTSQIGIYRRTGYTWTAASYTGYSYVIPIAAFKFKGVHYLSLWQRDSDGNDVFSLTTADDPKTVLKTQSALTYNSSAHMRCLDDKYIVGCTGFLNTSKGYIYKIVEDTDGLPLLTYDSKNSDILSSIVSVGNGNLVSSCFTVGDGYINLPNGRYKYDGVTLEKAQSLFPELSPTYLSQYINPVTGFAIGADPYTGKYGIIKTYTPLEQKWVACVPTMPTYYSDSLTGIVKENNSGILTVETVEDPNNPPPEYPDTYGLGYTVNSGSSQEADPGSVAINWGWYKSSGIYYKYSGGTATLDNVQGDKATTMNLYLVADAEGTITPVITTSEPLGYVSSHLLGKVYLSDTLDYFVDAPI